MLGMRCALFPALNLLTYLLTLGYQLSQNSKVQEAIDARTTEPIVRLPQQQARAVTYVTAETARLNEERRRHEAYFATHCKDWSSWKVWQEFIKGSCDDLDSDVLYDATTGVGTHVLPRTRWELHDYVDNLSLSLVKQHMDLIAERRSGDPLSAMMWAKLQCALYYKDIQAGKDASWNRGWASKTDLWNDYVRSSGNALSNLEAWLDNAEKKYNQPLCETRIQENFVTKLFEAICAGADLETGGWLTNECDAEKHRRRSQRAQHLSLIHI